MARETNLVVDDTCWEPQPVPAPSKRLVVRREGRSITRQATYWYLEEQGLGRVLQEGDL